jgi:citrate lyase beta subunit
MIYQIGLQNHPILRQQMVIGFMTLRCNDIDKQELFSKNMNNDKSDLTRQELAYRVGSLLYVPALNYKAISKIVGKGIYGAMSIAFCLEDSIDDSQVDVAESKVVETFNSLFQARDTDDKEPLFFIRVRSPKQMIEISNALGESVDILCGFILPKFDLINAKQYISAIKTINDQVERTVYIMPILETPSIAFANARRPVLEKLRTLFLSNKDYILNIRVGGNDFCHLFAVRVDAYHTIYDIGMIRDILSDIMNYFGQDFIISAPTSNYIAGGMETNRDEWKQKLKDEIKLDILNGFIGKTAIHPAQLEVINEAFMVKWNDYMDAQQIINWSNETLAVSKSVLQERMNERKVHSNWARKTIFRAEAYGIREGQK